MKRLGLLIIVFLLSACNVSPVNQDEINPQADFWLRIGGEVDKVLTSRALAPAVAVDVNGQPIVAWQESPTTSYDIYVKRWRKDLNGWESLGAKLDNLSLQNAIEPDIAVDQLGNPVVVWSELAGNSYDINVKRWSTGCCGSSWQKVGNSLDKDLLARADQPAIAVSDNGSPFVVWRESNKIYAKFWDGLSWIDLGQVNATNFLASSPDIALDTNDVPVIAWLEKGSDGKSDVYASKWNGSGWKSLASLHDTTQDATDLSLTTDLSGRPVVALVLDGNIVVKRLQGGTWQILGDVLDNAEINYVSSPSVSADQTDRIYVTWSELEGTNYNVYAKSWNGSWQALDTTLAISESKKALSSAVATNATGQVFVSWQEYSGALNREDIRVGQWTTQSWQPLGDTLDTVLKNSINNPSLDIDKSGSSVIAWIESANSIRSLYIKRWVGKSWVQLGEKVNSLNSLGLQILRINHLGHIYIAYLENSKLIVKRWQSGGWQALGSAISNVSSVDLDLGFTAGGLPVVLYAINNQLSLKRWNGTTWANWGGQINQGDTNYAVRFELGVSNSNQPYVIYIEEYEGVLKAKKLSGSAWESIGNLAVGTSDYNGVGFDMSVDQNSFPVVAFQGYYTGNYSIYVKRWDGTNWNSLGAALDVNVWRNSHSPSLDIDNLGNPVVIWQEVLLGEFDEKAVAFVKRWNGSQWILVGDDIYKFYYSNVQQPVIALKPDNSPVVGWRELNNLYVSSY